MTELLKWGDKEFKAGDLLVSVYDYRVITIFDIYASTDGFGGISVVLEIGEDGTRLMDADEFAYRVDQNQMTKMGTPLFAIGQTMTHHANNDTLEILAISERQDWNGEYKYFIRLVNEKGEVSFTCVEEGYLGRCLPYTKPADVSIALPDIELGAIFPSVILV